VVWNLGIRVKGLGLGVQDLGFKLLVLGLEVQGFGFGLADNGFMVYCLGFRD
jgi:hypothetical protein